MKHRLVKTLLCSFSLLVASSNFAAIEEVRFTDPALEQRYQELIAELRCLVCQNQNLADSNAGLAKDLRQKTAEMLRAGASNREILDYMSERYGDFVLYRPPVNAGTIWLWVIPILLLLIALTALALTVRNKQKSTASDALQINDQQRQDLRNRLSGEPHDE